MKTESTNGANESLAKGFFKKISSDMLLQISFLHSHFLKKKKINSSVINHKIEFLYCLLLKKIVFFFLIQEIKYSGYKKIDPK